jgi:broad specificity phosphatase PhoE
MSKIYLVRHGQTTNNVNRLYQGQRIDGELTEFGILQVGKIGEFLCQQKLAYIFSSPLGRAIKSSHLILEKFENCELKVIILDCLKEIDHGILDGKHIESVRTLFPELDPRSVEPMFQYFTQYPQGESFKDVFVRVESFGQIVRSLGMNIAIVSHRLITPMILAAILDLDPVSLTQLLLDNNEIIEVDLRKKEYNIIKF